MKQIFLFIAIISSNLAYAQKNFEGSVTYRLHSNTGDKPDAELRVLFGTKKLKVMFKEKEEYEKEVLIINLDSATVHAVNFETKTYKRSTLALTAPVQKAEKKLISGYSASPYQPENTGLSGLFGSLLGASNVVFYLADSLHYYIPAAFIGNKELLMVQQNRIVLGADIQVVSAFDQIADSSSKKAATVITVEATAIKPMTVDINEFVIPSDFADRITLQETYPADTAAVYVDTAVAVVDTAIIKPVKKAVKKKPVKRSAAKEGSTSKAIRRKG